MSTNVSNIRQGHLAHTFRAWQLLYSCWQLVLLRTVNIVYERYRGNHKNHSDERYERHAD
jgi:hypothetical protein